MSKPLYATIPYLGGTYTVQFECDSVPNEVGVGYCSERHLQGYGELPEKFRNIPIIDFKNNDNVFKFLKLDLYPVEAHTERWGNCTLKEYFQKILELGIEIKGDLSNFWKE